MKLIKQTEIQIPTWDGWIKDSRYIFSKEELIELIKYAQGATLAEDFNQEKYINSLLNVNSSNE